jgi:hypothetical protein
MNPAPSRQEKRREPRRPAQGSVEIRGAGLHLRGELIDVSHSGFRIAHKESSLEPGQVVEFTHPEASGAARVVWNRIVEQRVETGFFIVERR